MPHNCTPQFGKSVDAINYLHVNAHNVTECFWISALFIDTCLPVCVCLCGKFTSGTAIPPYVHINNRVQPEETFLIKSCCVLKYVGSGDVEVSDCSATGSAALLS